MGIGIVLALLGVGLAAGVFGGMFGIGGGSVIVLALVLFLGFTQVAANGTSLAALLLPVGIFAVREYIRQGKMHLPTAFTIGGGLAIGAWTGASIALGLEPRTLEVLFGLFLFYGGWRYLAPWEWYKEQRGMPTPPIREHTEVDLNAWRTRAIIVVVGIAAGVASGLFGIGGGLLIVPTLMALKVDQKTANGISLAALLLPVGLPAVIAYYQAGQLDVGVAIPVAIGLVGGAFLGARLALGLPTKTVRRAYGAFMGFSALLFLFGV